MKSRIKKAIVILLAFVLCIGQVGCRFVVREQQVLMNPQEEVVDNTQTEEVVQEEVAEEQATTPVTSTTNTEPALSGTLELQIWTNENEGVANAWTDVIDAFEQATGVKVTAYIGSQANTRMTKRWMGDNPPDIALLAGSGIPDVALEQSGGLYDLAELIKTGYVYGTNDKIWDVIEQNYFETTSDSTPYYRAKIYCSTNGVFWDQAYLNQLGLNAPTNYTELMNFVDVAKAKGVATFTTYGTAGHYALDSMIMSAIAAYGSDVYDKCSQGLASGWSSNEVREVFQRWYDFCRKDNALLTGTSSFDHTTSQMKWLNHDALLIGNGQWLPYEVANNTPTSFQMDMVTSPLTAENQTPAIVMKTGRMIVAKQAKNIDNAKAFIRFLYTKEAQKRLSEAQGYLPIRKDMDLNQLDYLDSQRRINNYIKSGKATIVYNKYDWGSLNDDINAAAHGLMTGNMTVDQAIQHILNRAK